MMSSSKASVAKKKKGPARVVLPSMLVVASSISLLVILLQFPTPATAAIVLTKTEEKCLEATGKLFEGNEKLIAARHNFASAMKMDMTTVKTMSARYSDEDLAAYDAACTAEGGTIHSIKIDFFDCTLKKMKREVELTLKNFANCLATVDECASFDQENLLEEAWEELGLHCELESSPTNPTNDDDDKVPRGGKDDPPVALDDDLAKEEKKDAANGADDVDKAEKAAEYIPKEDQGKKRKKGGGRFSLFLFVCLVGAAGYYVYDRRRRMQRLPWGGVTTSRFQSQGPPMMFHTNYNLVSGDEELNFDAGNELQLSSNLMA
jgi:hypothetical protein